MSCLARRRADIPSQRSLHDESAIFRRSRYFTAGLVHRRTCLNRDNRMRERLITSHVRVSNSCAHAIHWNDSLLQSQSIIISLVSVFLSLCGAFNYFKVYFVRSNYQIDYYTHEYVIFSRCYYNVKIYFKWTNRKVHIPYNHTVADILYYALSRWWARCTEVQVSPIVTYSDFIWG